MQRHAEMAASNLLITAVWCPHKAAPTRDTGAMSPSARRLPLVLSLVPSLVFAVSACTANAPPSPEPTPSGSVAPSTVPTAPTTAATAAPFQGWSDPVATGKPFGTKVNGLLTFRGNPTRTFYGTGPAVRSNPTQLWAFPKNADMCGTTSISGVV